MDDPAVLPDVSLEGGGELCAFFRSHGATTFREAARIIRGWPYFWPDPKPASIAQCLELQGGTCTEKHAVAAACAKELDLAVYKAVGIYPLDAALVEGVGPLLAARGIRALPALHCFLVYGRYRVDLTEGNCSGKTGPIDRFWSVKTFAPLPAQAELDEWLDLRRRCAEILRLSVACQH
jgi:hypothetical protein